MVDVLVLATCHMQHATVGCFSVSILKPCHTRMFQRVNVNTETLTRCTSRRCRKWSIIRRQLLLTLGAPSPDNDCHIDIAPKWLSESQYKSSIPEVTEIMNHLGSSEKLHGTCGRGSTERKY